METVQNHTTAAKTRKKLNHAHHDLNLLEGERGTLPTEIYLQRKHSLNRQIELMQTALNDFDKSRVVMVY